MKLLDIYRCLCDGTRLRMLHLLAQGPLCVCHFQSILGSPQVAVSKHLAYLRGHGLVTARRREQWMIYSLCEPRPAELQRQLDCLRECAKAYPEFQGDLRRLKKLRVDCGGKLVQSPRSPKSKVGGQLEPTHVGCYE